MSDVRGVHRSARGCRRARGPARQPRRRREDVASRLLAFAEERGWRRLRFLSSAENTYNVDSYAETPEGAQRPMLTVFHRDTDAIRHFGSSELFYAAAEPGQDPRHVGTLEPLWNLFDLTPEGRPSHWVEQLNYGPTPA